MFNDFQYTCQLCIRILKENMRKSINEERKNITSGSHHIGIVDRQGLRRCRYHPLPVKM